MESIEIYTAPNEIIAKMFQGVLEKENIKSVVTPSQSGGAFRGNYGGATPPFDPWTISVSKHNIERAKEILKSITDVSVS